MGVVDNIHENRFDPDLVEARILRPLPAEWVGTSNGLIKTAGGDPAELIRRVRTHLVQLDPELETQIFPLARFYQQEQLAVRLLALVMTLSVLAVMTLSAAGIYASGLHS